MNEINDRYIHYNPNKKAKAKSTMMAKVDNLTPTKLIEECIKNKGGKQ